MTSKQKWRHEAKFGVYNPPSIELCPLNARFDLVSGEGDDELAEVYQIDFPGGDLEDDEVDDDVVSDIGIGGAVYDGPFVDTVLSPARAGAQAFSKRLIDGHIDKGESLATGLRTLGAVKECFVDMIDADVSTRSRTLTHTHTHSRAHTNTHTHTHTHTRHALAAPQTLAHVRRPVGRYVP